MQKLQIIYTITATHQKRQKS